MQTDAASIVQHVLALVQQYSGAETTGGEDRLIAAEIGCTGYDSIALVDSIEAAYGVDLRPLIEIEVQRGWLRKRTTRVGRDVTAREIAEYVAG